MTNLNELTDYSDVFDVIISNRSVIEKVAPEDFIDTELFIPWIEENDDNDGSKEVFEQHLKSMQEHVDKDKVYLVMSLRRAEEVTGPLTNCNVAFLCKCATHVELIPDYGIDDIYFVFEAGATGDGEPCLATYTAEEAERDVATWGSIG